MAVKSLGTLTLNLVTETGGFTGPLQKAQQDVRKTTAQMARSVQNAGLIVAGVGTAFLGAATAAVTLTRAVAESTTELQKQATVAGISAAEMQAWGAAAQSVGIESDKLSDIFKDVQDKIGDFAATGGGELQDFFNNIATQVGVTIEDFQNLSGPESLGLFIDTLNQAGVSSQEMTFYLEGLADEASLLGPTFAAMASEAQNITDIINDMGLALTSLDTANLHDFTTAFNQVQVILQAVGQTIAAELSPYITELLADTVDAARGFDGLRDSINSFVEGALTGIGSVLDISHQLDIAFATVQVAGSEMGTAIALVFADVEQAVLRLVNNTIAELNRLGAAIANLPGLDGFQIGTVASTSVFTENLEFMRQKTEDLKSSLDDLRNAPKPSEVIGDYLEGVEARQQFNQLTSIASLVTDQNTNAISNNAAATNDAANASKAAAAANQEAAKAQREAERAAQQQIQAYTNLLDTLFPLEASQKQYTEDLRLLDVAYQQDTISADKLAEAQKRLREQSAEGLGGFEDAPVYGGLDASIGGVGGEFGKIEDAAAALEEWHSAQLEQLAEFRAERADLNSEWNERELEIEKQYQKQRQDLNDATSTALLAANEDLYGNLAETVKGFAGEQSALYQTLFAVQKGFAIAQSLVAIQQGIALAAANPWPLNLAAMASVAAATASIVGNIQAIQMVGQAHDGIMSVPQSGSWNLERGERVLTEDTSANLDQTLANVDRSTQRNARGGVEVNLHEDASKAGQTQTADIDEKAVIDIFVANITRDGKAHQALVGKYPLKTRGR